MARIELWSGCTTYQVENSLLDEFGIMEEWDKLSLEQKAKLTQLIADGNLLKVKRMCCVELVL